MTSERHTNNNNKNNNIYVPKTARARGQKYRHTILIIWGFFKM